MINQDVFSAHEKLCPDVRDVRWTSNCAGEIFLIDGDEIGVRIGHFQGDALLAAFIVEAHNSTLNETHIAAAKT